MDDGRVHCFMVEETGRARYHSGLISKSEFSACPNGGLHVARVYGDPLPNGDLDWSLQPPITGPLHCACGFELVDRVNANRFGGHGPEWRRVDTGETAWRPTEFGPGAMYFVRGEHACFPHDPPCSEHLHVVCPDGHSWDIDGRANNCTMKDDKVHHCWVRSGTPPLVTVHKRGVTCKAGGGSIQTSRYHGFLGGSDGASPGVFVP